MYRGGFAHAARAIAFTFDKGMMEQIGTYSSPRKNNKKKFFFHLYVNCIYYLFFFAGGYLHLCSAFSNELEKKRKMIASISYLFFLYDKFGIEIFFSVDG